MLISWIYRILFKKLQYIWQLASLLMNPERLACTLSQSHLLGRIPFVVRLVLQTASSFPYPAQKWSWFACKRLKRQQHFAHYGDPRQQGETRKPVFVRLGKFQPGLSNCIREKFRKQSVDVPLYILFACLPEECFGTKSTSNVNWWKDYLLNWSGKRRILIKVAFHACIFLSIIFTPRRNFLA